MTRPETPRPAPFQIVLVEPEIFDIDPLQCSRCGGRMRFVEVV